MKKFMSREKKSNPYAYTKKKRLLFWLMITVFLAINIYILVYRNTGYKYFPFKTYSELYVTDSTLYLRDIYFNDDSVRLSFSLPLPASKYYLSVDDGLQKDTIIAKGNLLVLPVYTNLHAYALSPIDGKHTFVILKIDHDTKQHPYINELLYSSLPGPQIKVSSLHLWMNGANGFSKEEMVNGAQMLKEKTTVFKQHTDSATVMEIAKFCSSLCNNPKGIHGDLSAGLRPYEQILQAQKCNIFMDCGNYSGIFQYLATVAGLANRIVIYQGGADNWQYGMHYFNEVYLRERQQWVLADALNNIYMPYDTVRFYNAVDVKKMAEINNFSQKYVYTFKNDTAKVVPYDSILYLQYYNQSNANLCFWYPGKDHSLNTWRNFFDFYSFSRNVDFYSDVNRNDWMKIIVKETFFIGWIILLLFYFVFEWRLVRKNNKLPV
jgi:hypothetical protein